MRIVQLTARSASDGQLHLHIPAEADTEFDIAVVVQPKAATNGTTEPLTSTPPGWPPGFLEATYGSIQDESFVAPTRSPPRKVEPLS